MCSRLGCPRRQGKTDKGPNPAGEGEPSENRPHVDRLDQTALGSRLRQTAIRGYRMIRIIIPHHLRTLAQCGAEVAIDVAAPITLRALFDALEARYPALRG